MTPEVVPLAERRPARIAGGAASVPEEKPKVVGFVRDSLRMQTPRDLAIEHCADQIARAMGGLSLHQRIGLERALDALVDEVAWHRQDPWC